MTITKINHQAISASAGSGKTFQLAHRYMALLAHRVNPDRIIALTFSRKAAGEIFDSIVNYLCQAASSREKAQETGQRIGKPDFREHDFLHLLRILVESLHRLHISTLDSFTVRVIQSFPMELGIPAHLEMLDNEGAAAQSTRQEVLNAIFDRRRTDASVQREFMDGFQQSTFGRDEKILGRSLDNFIGAYQGYYQILPLPEAWGDRDMVWPGGSPWLDEAHDVNSAAENLKSLLEGESLPDGAMNRWETFIEAARSYQPGSPWKEIDYLFKKLSEEVEALREGNASLVVDKKRQDLSAEESRLALQLLGHIMRTEILTSLEQTRGIYRVLNQYERLYDSMVRRRGKLTFTDAQYLLTAGSGGSMISRSPSEEARLYIDFRLNCKLDHWLLDEFQDTSDLQWEVLRNLADEILQDDSGQRSFFYVGDVKQAIYGWRGGNARLFGAILEQYGEQIEQHSMNTSFRSSQPVIDTVNQVFGFASGGPSELPEETRTEWSKMWQHHYCQPGSVPPQGYVALLEAQPQESEGKANDEERQRIVANLLREVDPARRGLSTAILVRTNDNGRQMVNFLRAECPGMNIVHEGKAAIEDNPVVSLLLSLVKFAAHPGDTFAQRHLEMSPLREKLEIRNPKSEFSKRNLSVSLLADIQKDGFQSFIRMWGDQLDRAHPLDDFGRSRLGNLIEAAGEFDQTSSRNCDEFLRFVDSYQLHELASESAVRVMTIHQSKGLGFDVVILPDLQGRNMTDGGQPGLVMARDPYDNRPVWALKMPRKVVAQTDPVLASQVQASDEAACFDSLCVLYVAMTRAKRALYMVTGYPGKNARAITSAAFLKRQLASELAPEDSSVIKLDGDDAVCLYEVGERDWYAAVPGIEVAAEPERPSDVPGDFSARPSSRQRLANVLPSREGESEQSAAMLFERSYRDRLDFGTAVHALFRMVSFIEEVDEKELAREWYETSSVETGVKDRVVEEFSRAMASPEVREELSRPQGNVELWREKGFEIVLEDRWVTGVFDRVTIVRDEGGMPLRAALVDFKTDTVASESEIEQVARRYDSQIQLYRSALSRMLGLDPSRISARLLFTRIGKLYNMK